MSDLSRAIDFDKLTEEEKQACLDYFLEKAEKNRFKNKIERRERI
jgi:hypothetical protein